MKITHDVMWIRYFQGGMTWLALRCSIFYEHRRPSARRRTCELDFSTTNLREPVKVFSCLIKYDQPAGDDEAAGDADDKQKADNVGIDIPTVIETADEAGGLEGE